MSHDSDHLVEVHDIVLKRIHEAAFGRSDTQEAQTRRDISLLGTIKKLLGIPE